MTRIFPEYLDSGSVLNIAESDGIRGSSYRATGNQAAHVQLLSKVTNFTDVWKTTHTSDAIIVD